MKYHILNDFRTSTSFQGKSFDRFNPISTVRGVHPDFCFMPVMFLFFSQFSPNLVTFPKT